MACDARPCDVTSLQHVHASQCSDFCPARMSWCDHRLSWQRCASVAVYGKLSHHSRHSGCRWCLFASCKVGLATTSCSDEGPLSAARVAWVSGVSARELPHVPGLPCVACSQPRTDLRAGCASCAPTRVTTSVLRADLQDMQASADDTTVMTQPARRVVLQAGR